MNDVINFGKKVLYGLLWVLKKYVSVYPYLYNKYGWKGLLADAAIFVVTFFILGAISDLILNSRDERKKRKRGEQFEIRVASRLEKALNTTVYHSLLLPDGHDGTTEVDLCAVTKKGIFLFECKNRPFKFYTYGSIFKNDEWKIEENHGKLISTLKSPYEQNKGHIAALIRALPNGASSHKFFNVVVMGTHNLRMDDGTGRHIEAPDYNKFDEFKTYIMAKDRESYFAKAHDALPDVYDDEMVQALGSFLHSLEGTPERLKAHRDYVMLKHAKGWD